MNKTIEELAKQYAEYMCPVGDYCGGVYDEQRNSDIPIYTDDAKSVLEWLFNKPLAQRLTADEKERVRKLHGASIVANRMFGKDDRAFDALERIFGDDFFKEGE